MLWRDDLGERGPGVIVSEQLDSRLPTVADRENFVRMHVPAGHFGEPRDLAVLVALLASPLGRALHQRRGHRGRRRHAPVRVLTGGRAAGEAWCAAVASSQ